MRGFIRKLKDKMFADKKLVVIVLAGVAGILLLVLSEILPQEKQELNNEDEMIGEVMFENYEKKLEKRLEQLIETINGAGKVKVMVTVESGDEKVFATESTKSERSEEKSYVIIDSRDEDGGLLLKTTQPVVRGVAVVCQGADSAAVKQEITNTVVSVLGISSNRVNIAKMKNTDGG